MDLGVGMQSPSDDVKTRDAVLSLANVASMDSAECQGSRGVAEIRPRLGAAAIGGSKSTSPTLIGAPRASEHPRRGEWKAVEGFLSLLPCPPSTSSTSRLTRWLGFRCA